MEPIAEKKAQNVGMIVNLGWIPLKKAIFNSTIEPNYIKEVSYDTELPGLFAQVRDSNTGYVYNTEGEDIEYKIEEFIDKEVELSGYLRKGQEPDAGVGRRYFWKNGMRTFVDLKMMSSFYNFCNVWSSDHYYLELATNKNLPLLAEKSEILPSNFKDAIKSVQLYPSNQEKRNVISMVLVSFLAGVATFVI